MVMVALAGCSPGADGTADRHATLTVLAAASLTDAFSEIGWEFEAANPDVSVAFNFAGSNQLATQIVEGAPADVFASANSEQMDVVMEAGRIDPAGPMGFATNRLVVVFPADNPAGLTRLQDLAKPDILIVMAAEQVPVGRYSLEFLDRASADPAFGPTFRDDVLQNVVSFEENVRGVLNKVALGEADAGIVYASDLFESTGIDHLDIPDSLNSIAEYPIAALNDSANDDIAAAFVTYVLGSEGQTILSEYGFAPPLNP